MSVVYSPRIESFRAPCLSSGVSDDAGRWEAQENNIRENMSKATSIDGEEMEQELLKLLEEHSDDNWDGYGAKSITLESFLYAISFWQMLPTTVPRPDLGVDPDGGVVFEWYRSPRRVFSVTIEKDKRLTYAGLFDSNKASGTEYFDCDVPELIFRHILRAL